VNPWKFGCQAKVRKQEDKMALRITTEPMEQRQMALRVEVPQDRVDQELHKAARKLAGQYRIPGFRKGKAPYNLLVQYVGLPALFQEFIEPLGQEIYPQALEESKLEPYAPGILDVESLEPLTYKFVVPLEPEIDLGDYRSLRVEESPVEVTDEEVEQQLEEYRSQFSSHGDVDRPSQYGDLITLDVKSVIAPAEEGGEETVVLDETDWDVTPDEENPMDPPGFDEALLGLRPGEEKDFVLSWPADSQSIHAGKEAKFHVKVHKIQGTTKPTLDDSFAQMVGPEFETLDALKENIRTTLLESKKAEGDEEYLEKALDALMAQSTLNYPPTVVEDQLDTMVNTLERQLREYGIENMEQYLQQMGQSIEQYRDSLRPQAEVMAKRNLLISEIFRQEGISVSDEEIDERINRMLGITPTTSEAEDITDIETAEAVIEASLDDDVEDDEHEHDDDDEYDVEANDHDDDEHDHHHHEGHDHDHDHDHDHTGHTHAANDADTMRALRDMMKSGSGRAVLESQILQENSIARLLAIVRGEEVPPRPEPKAEVASENAASTDTNADAAAEESSEETPEKDESAA
jgi:trigger factor